MKHSHTAATALVVLFALAAAPSVKAGEGFFEKIGDGPRRAVEGLVKHPQRIFPICWGSDRCDEPSKEPTKVAAPTYSATYRVDCKDAVTGADRADNTITVTSPVSVDEARNEIIRRYQSSDLCQANGDTSRVTKLGSGRWM